MLQFAVRIKGLDDEDDNRCRWALAVDGERVLVAHEDATLHWHPMEDCTIAKLVMPDAPIPVIPVQQRPTGPELLRPKYDLRGNGA